MTDNQTSQTTGLYSLTIEVANVLGRRVVRLDPHDPEDMESSDALWLSYTPEDELRYGRAVYVSPAMPDSSLPMWAIEECVENKFGGSVTFWSQIGSGPEVLAALESVYG